MKKFSLTRKYPAPMRLTEWGYVIVLALLQLTSSAQPQKNIQFHHFSEEQGLPKLNAGTIIQDKKGYIWLGSKRYDGTSIKTFKANPSDKNSFVPEGVHRLINDINGNLWGLAWNPTVFKYDPDTEVFTEYFARDTVFPPCWVSCLAADKQGKIWFGMNCYGKTAGLGYCDPALDLLVDFSKIIYPDTLCNRVVSSLLFDRNGLLWIGTANGINIYDPIHKKISLFDPDDKVFSSINKSVTCMLEDHTGNIWLSLHNEGIYRFNPSTGASKLYHHSDADNNSLCSDIVNTLIEDSHHNIWAGGYGGISIYRPDSDDFKSYQADPNNRYSLSSDLVSTLFEDRSGALWVGTNGGGLNICYPQAKNFLFYENTNKKEAASSWATDLHIDATGKIYMTTFGAGLKEFDPVTRTMKSYKIELPKTGLKANYYFGIFQSSDGNIWEVGLDEGLQKLDIKSGMFTTIYSRRGEVLTCIAEDLDKRLWIGGNTELHCYDMKTNKYFRAKDLYSNIGRISAIARLYCDRDGILWIGSPWGLVLLDTKTGNLKTYKHENNNPHSLVDNDVNSFYDDGKGKVWIGTHGGLSAFDRSSEQFVSYTIKDGLPNKNVLGIVPDEAGNLWLGTGSGICKFSPPSFKNTKPVFRNYNSHDGLPGDGFSWGQKGPDGTLYFVCAEGVVSFKPDELNDNQFVPPVAITGLIVNDKSINQNDSTGILKFPFGQTKKIKLSYRQNDFSFSFSAFNYVHSKKNRFAYKLEEYDKDWKYTDEAIRFASYTNMDPGEYTFRVKGSNNDGVVWNEEGASIKLIITPPYWKTTWFKLLCVLVAGVILYGIYYNRLQQIRDIRRIRNKIASDLHDDLGATLSSISIMSELVNQQVKTQVPEASSLLEKIGTSSRNMIESVNDMVWAINPQNDSFENIIKRMRSFGSEILAPKDIAFHFDFDKNLAQSKLKMDMRRNFYLIFKEAVNNIAKYSGAANAFVMIWNRDASLKMTIRDDGSGFEMKTVKAGNGLINMQQRAEMLKGRFNLESVPGKGTIIELEFKNE